MAVTPFKIFAGGEVLTASDLNASLAQVFDNGEDLAYPATQARDYNGQELILDADGDSSITSDTDDQIDFKLGGTDYVVFAAVATSNIVDINGGVTTTGNVLDIGNADSLTTGGILNLVSNSADTSARNLVTIHNNNSAAVGTRLLNLVQDAADPAVVITQNANEIALDINSSATTTNIVDIDASTITAGIVIDVASADALTTGTILNLISNSAATNPRQLVDIQNTNALATGAIPLRVVQDSTGNGVFIDHNGNGRALNIDAQCTTADAVYIEADQVTTGNIINIPDADSLTTGSILNLVSNSLDGSARNLVLIHNNSSSAGDTTCLTLDQDANEAALSIVSDATTAATLSVIAATTTGDTVSIVANSLTSGVALNVSSNSSSTGDFSIARFTNDNASASDCDVVEIFQDADSPALFTTVRNETYSQSIEIIACYTSAASTWTFLQLVSDWNGSPDTEFRFRGDGEAFADGSFTGGGADYAEYFEWADGNPDNEDRRGVAVQLVGRFIEPAPDGKKVFGVISGNPSVVGNAAWNKWRGKYLKDDFDCYVMEDYEVWRWMDGDKLIILEADKIGPDMMVPDDKEVVIQQRRKLNPEFDPEMEYIPREFRKEWGCVGLLGVLRVRKDQPVNPSWKKMDDISDNVVEYFALPTPPL